ncbi:hypothetical protein T484DRAFT_3446767 [Baffinella frigidus]|nr:hypothetical protein T484DRAFT_3446767 [Cryptophyta sp. CCMP2293]
MVLGWVCYFTHKTRLDIAYKLDRLCYLPRGIDAFFSFRGGVIMPVYATLFSKQLRPALFRG